MDFKKWLEVIEENFPNLVGAAEVAMSVVCELFIDDFIKPLWLVIIDASGAGKTIALNFFCELDKLVLLLDDYSAASLQSHAANRTKEELEAIDLIPQLKDKVFLVRDFSTFFMKRDEELRPALGRLIRLLDGEGLITSSGTHGIRKCTGRHLFMILGGAMPMASRVWVIMNEKGSRMFTLYLDTIEDGEEELANQNKSKYSVDEKENICRKATVELIENLQKNGKVKWDKYKQDDKIYIYIARLAKIASHLRGVVNEDGILLVEKPNRLNKLLYDLTRGHALACGRNYIKEKDLKVAIKVALSTTSLQRAKIVGALINNNGVVYTSEVIKILKCSRPIAIKYMREVKQLGISKLCRVGGEIGRPEYKLKLRDKYQWFISDEFKALSHTHRQNP